MYAVSFFLTTIVQRPHEPHLDILKIVLKNRLESKV